ncbi:hypothetical protein PL11201_450140 [Planktothrix sp. PCC 11201]|nr:hypothetical protein [Planktothrix sp. PCC 11201]SKB12981.1 hypothetical protein PL11201_450140 [Planktothrix sp. PCC 11201]
MVKLENKSLSEGLILTNGFPTVSREQIIALLEEAKKQLFSRVA